MVRRVLISLSAALVLSLAACGGDDEPDEAAQVVTATPTTAVAQATPPAAEAPATTPPPAETPPPSQTAPAAETPPPAGAPTIVQPSAPGRPSTTSPPPAAPAPASGVTHGKEPNDKPKQANGPASAGGFESIVDSNNDTDWFYWRVRPGRTVDILAQHVEGDCSSTFLAFTGTDGQIFSTDKVSVSPGGELPETGSYTAPRAGGYVVGRLQGDDDDGVGGALGCRLQVRVTPEDAIDEAPGPNDAAFLGRIRR